MIHKSIGLLAVLFLLGLCFGTPATAGADTGDPTSDLGIVAAQEGDAGSWIDGTPFLRQFRGTVTQQPLTNQDLRDMGRLDEVGNVLAYNVGDRHTFTTYSFQGLCGSMSLPTCANNTPATLRAVGSHTYVWLADAQTVMTPTLEAIRDEFELIYSRTVSYFGAPPDVDRDPRIHILMFDIQDDYNPPTTTVYVGGYFDPSDQSGQNRMDMFYMDCVQLAPATQGFYGTLAHEFQHMIHFQHDGDEENWINEGLSDFSYVINGYGVPTSHINAFRDHPEKNLTLWSGDSALTLANYGASYMFVEYLTELVERHGKSIPDFTKALVDESQNSITGLNAVMPGYLPADRDTFAEVFDMWLVANYARADSGDYRYTRSGLENFRVRIQEDTNGDSYTDKLTNDGQRYERKDRSLDEWAADYWAFEAGANIAQVQAIIDGENNWWPTGNLDNPINALIAYRPGDIFDSVATSHSVDLTYSVQNISGAAVRVVVVVGNQDGFIDGKGDYDLTVEAANANPNILAPTQAAPDFVGSNTSPTKTLLEIDVKTAGGTFIVGLEPTHFTIQIGGKSADVLVARELDNKYVLEIQPPTQAAEGAYDLSVTVFGNTDRESKAIQYGAVGGSNVDVDLVIDRSGSMYGSPIASAKSSAKMFVDLMALNDMIGVVSFDDIVETTYPLSVVQASPDTKSAAKTAIDGLYARNSTSIGGGIARGRDQLTGRGNSNHPWAMVLLSDGKENTSPTVDSVLPSIVNTKIKVFAIGLGSVDEALMQKIAYQTGGNYYYTPTDAELAAIYNSISGQVAGRQTLYQYTGAVQQGQINSQIVNVDQAVEEALFSITWNTTTSDLDLTLRSPSGRTINPTVAQSDPNIEFVSGQTYEYYKVRQPESGAWTINVYGTHASTISPALAVVPAAVDGEAFNLSVQAATGLTLQAAFDKGSYEVGEGINLQISLSDSAPIKGARVTARVQRPDTKVDTVTFFDDGKHADGKAGDGVYSNFYARTDTPGTYRFTVEAAGESSKRFSFRRTAELSAAIINASDRDGDSMPDNWEDAVGLDRQRDDRNGDPDQDTLANQAEYRYGTDPFAKDTDGDKLTDGAEVNTYHTNPTNIDTDLGGVDDGAEVARGTDPLDGADDVTARWRAFRLPFMLSRSWIAPQPGWRQSAGLAGRIVYDVAGTDATCNTLFAGTDNGLYRSFNAGRSWAPTAVAAAVSQAGAVSFDELASPSSNLTPSVVVCRANTNVIYLTRWGEGIFRSTDGGNSWQARSGNLGDPYVYDLAVDPRNCDVAYAATSKLGVYKTSNGGAYWQTQNSGLGVLELRSLIAAPGSPDRLYAGAVSGVYRSNNGGASWTATGGLPAASVWALAAPPASPDTVYAGLEGSGVYVSLNGGGFWQAGSGLDGMRARALAVDPISPQWIYAGRDDGNGGVYRSQDGGANWARFSTGLGTQKVKALWLDGGVCQALLAGTTDGVWYYTH